MWGIAAQAEINEAAAAVPLPGDAPLARELLRFQNTVSKPEINDLKQYIAAELAPVDCATDAVDGKSAGNPSSPSQVGRGRYANHSGNGASKYAKAQMMRIMFVHNLGESLELQHTPLQTSVSDLVQDGAPIRVRDDVLPLAHGRFVMWCQQLVEE
ncbi:hypothetical protein CYMTET_52295 [Cymbomonas tetramitiformis]|uniref:Uncharacterized protein n=1 Tax=Cymbomonas tetramitiformis TaxID=36881 RepID=A0AAE0BKZ3_9CHLO|nr:hypothetical protein CYMTET_52295 [Cymbomonas tetramitiformis]